MTDDNDPFATLAGMKDNPPKVVTVATTAAATGTQSTTAPPPPPLPAPPREEEANASDAREILVGIYVDGTMDAALRLFEDVRVGGTGARPSRSAVGNWLLTLGLEAARAQGLTSVPPSFVKKRRRG